MKRLSKQVFTLCLVSLSFLGALEVCSLFEKQWLGLSFTSIHLLQSNTMYFALWRLTLGVFLFCVWPSFIRVCATRQGWSEAAYQARLQWRWPLAVCFVVFDLVFVEHVFRIFF